MLLHIQITILLISIRASAKVPDRGFIVLIRVHVDWLDFVDYRG